MTSVASAAAQLPAVSHADEMCAPGFLRIPSHLDGFMQTGEPKESVRTEEFGTSARRCSRPVQILTVPGRLAAREAPSCPCCRKAMEGNGQVPIGASAPPFGHGEGKGRGLAAKMGMQGMRDFQHRGCSLQGARAAHHAASPHVRV